MSSNRIYIEQGAASVQRYVQTNSITAIHRWYRSNFGPPAPLRDSIRRWHDHFTRFETVADREGLQ